jgi:hypothetical protein
VVKIELKTVGDTALTFNAQLVEQPKISIPKARTKVNKKGKEHRIGSSSKHRGGSLVPGNADNLHFIETQGWENPIKTTLPES